MRIVAFASVVTLLAAFGLNGCNEHKTTRDGSVDDGSTGDGPASDRSTGDASMSDGSTGDASTGDRSTGDHPLCPAGTVNVGEACVKPTWVLDDATGSD